MSLQTVLSLLLSQAGPLSLIKNQPDGLTISFYILFLSALAIGAFFYLYLLYCLHFVKTNVIIHASV